MNIVKISTSGLTSDDVIAVARQQAEISISEAALDSMAQSRKQIETLAASDSPVYGVSTGFGALAQRHIPAESRTQLQRSLIRSHAAGTGAPVEREVVRATMTLRLKTLASGRTGARPIVAQTIAALLNAGITPVVYEYGSLGCSGDLAPLAHCALVLMGEGEATDANGLAHPVTELLAEAGITPLELHEKEGLALINGTDGMLGMLIMAIADLGSISERRTDRMLDKNRSHGLPPFLAYDPGVDSGLMIAQYTQAGLVSENKRLAVPASVDSIPSSAMQEDHVSMGWHAARKLRTAVDNLTAIIAIELMTAARAIELRAPLAPAARTAQVIAELRESVPGPGPDRFLAPEIAATITYVKTADATTA